MSPLLLIIGLSCGRLERLSRLYVSDMVPRDDSDYMLELPQLSGRSADGRECAVVWARPTKGLPEKDR